MNPEYKKHLPYLVLIGAALLLAFSPAILGIYPFHDDIFFWGLPFSPKRFPMMCSLTVFVGRSIGAFILWFFYYFVKTVTDLNTIRLINCLVIACCAFGAYGLLFKYLKRPIDAALSAIMLFSLPAFEVWAFHVGQSCELYAAVFVMIALYAVDAMPLEGRWWQRMGGEAGIIAVISLVLSNFIYPSLTTFYWAMALVLILAHMGSDSGQVRKKIGNIYMSGLTGMFLFACLFKLRKYFINFSFTTSYKPDAFVSNFSAKALWFFQTVMPQSLNLWNIFPNKVLPVFIILFLAGAVVLTLIKEFKKGAPKDSWLKIISGFLIVTSLIILTYLPNLLCAINFNPYRCAEGLTAIFIILSIWALKTYCQCIPPSAGLRVVTIILSLVCLWGGYRCFDNIDRFRVSPSSLEYSYLKSSMNKFHGQLKEIYVVAPKSSDLYYYYDEFGVSGYTFDRYDHVVKLISAMLVDIESQSGMTWMSIQRVGSSEEFKYFFKDVRSSVVKPVYSTFTIKILFGPKPKIIDQDSTLLIDMNSLYGPLKQIMGRDYNFKVINKGSWAGEE